MTTPASEEFPRTGWQNLVDRNRLGILGAAIILVAVSLVYQPSWQAGFLWDDFTLVTENPNLSASHGLWRIWTTSAADICPLTLTTFWAEHQVWGNTALPYHLVSILLHGISALLLWQVLRALSVDGAWIGAVLWALHPVHVESVAWIAEMKNTQSTLFYLLAGWFYVASLPSAKPEKWWTGGGSAYVLTLVCSALAMTSKTTTVVLPVVLSLCAWWVEGRFRWQQFIRLVPVFLLAMLAGVLSLLNQRMAGASDPGGLPSLRERLVIAGDAIWFYLGKLIWPQPLLTIYPKWQVEPASLLAWVPLVSALILVAFFWHRRKQGCRPLFFAWAYFLIALAPTLGLANMAFSRYAFVADHFQYLADMGPLALVGAGLTRGADWITPHFFLPARLAGGALLVVIGFLSWERAGVYRSERTLWTDELSKNSSCWAAYYNLADAALTEKQPDRAIQLSQRALELNPKYAEAHNNLGIALQQLGNMKDAAVQFQQAVHYSPHYSDGHNNLGGALLSFGRIDDAIRELQTALDLGSLRPDTHYDLALAYMQKNQVQAAIAQYQAALELSPNDSQTLNNLGLALLQAGRVDDGLNCFTRAVEVDPLNADARENLGNVYLQKGHLAEARACYCIALKLNPTDAEAHNNYGVALLQSSQPAQAILEFKKALHLKPDFPQAQAALIAAQSDLSHSIVR